MNWSDKCDVHVEADAPLAPLTWYGLGGPAQFLVSPRSPESLSQVLQNAQDEGLPTKILGAGANVLIRDDGFRGVVLRLDQPIFREMRFEGNRLFAGAGCDLMQLCNAAVERGLSGLECLAGIPGTVGGAIRMNAGGKFGMTSDIVVRADVLTAEGVVESWTQEKLGFGYRKSAVGDNIVLAAEFQLEERNLHDVRARFKEYWDYKKQSQPLGARSAGCVFKNPLGLAAAKLIDEAGLKGRRCGGAVVSERHANFIAAEATATAGDVLRLIDQVRDVVHDQFGVQLELEIDVW